MQPKLRFLKLETQMQAKWALYQHTVLGVPQTQAAL